MCLLHNKKWIYITIIYSSGMQSVQCEEQGRSKYNRTYRGDLGFFGFSSKGWWNSSIHSPMFISGITEESTNRGFISIAFFLPFFPLEELLPFPFPVVLVTYRNNSEGESKTSSGIFTAVLSTFKARPWLRVDTNLINLSMKSFKTWINLHNLKKGCYLRSNSVLCWSNSA